MATHFTIVQYYFIFLKPDTLAGFEPEFFSSVGGRDDHYAIMPRTCFRYLYHAITTYSGHNKIIGSFAFDSKRFCLSESRFTTSAPLFTLLIAPSPITHILWTRRIMMSSFIESHLANCCLLPSLAYFTVCFDLTFWYTFLAHSGRSTSKRRNNLN
jgi:hypothetical protein